MKFKLGDKVTFKKTGCPGVGIVRGIMTPDLCEGNPPWKDVYPDWENKLLYSIKFNQPQKLASFEEYLQQLPPDIPLTDEQLKLDYLNRVPYVQGAIYPEDDLELL